MNYNPSPRSGRTTWRMYTVRDGKKIERLARAGQAPRCPCCGEALESQPGSRLSPCLVLDATAYDLACRSCRRFWCMVEQTPRSLRLLRMRRLAAAVRAVNAPDLGGPPSREVIRATAR